MRKKLLCLILAIIISVSLMPVVSQASASVLYVGDTDVTPTALHKITYWKATDKGSYAYADSGKSNSYEFSVESDGKGYTLTLNNAKITSCDFTNPSDRSHKYNIYSSEVLNIFLKGEDAINSYGEADYSIYSKKGINISGEGDLTATEIIAENGDIKIDNEYIKLESKANDCIYAQNGNINLTDSYIAVSSDTKNGIKGNGDITIKGGNISSDGKEDGIYVEGSMLLGDAIVITSGSVEGVYTGGDSTSAGGYLCTYGSYYGLRSFNGNITVTGGEVYAAGNSCGIYGSDNKSKKVSIKGGSINTTGDMYGIYSTGDINITGGAIDAYGNKAAMYSTSSITPKAAYKNDAIIMTKYDGKTYTPTVLLNIYNTDEPSINMSIGAISFSRNDMTCWTGVENDTVYGNFYSDISDTKLYGSYTWSVKYNTNSTKMDFTDDSYDLTLNNAEILDYSKNKALENGNVSASTYTNGNLNLNLIGSSSLGSYNYQSDYGVSTAGYLNVSGTGILSLSSIKCGLEAKGNVSVKGGDIIAFCSDDQGTAVKVGGSLSVSSGSLDGFGKIGGILVSGGDLAVSGGYLFGNGSLSGIYNNSGNIQISGGTVYANSESSAMVIKRGKALILPENYISCSDSEKGKKINKYTSAGYTYSFNDLSVTIDAEQFIEVKNIASDGTALQKPEGVIKARADMKKSDAGSVELTVTDLENKKADFKLDKDYVLYPFSAVLYESGTSNIYKTPDNFSVTVFIPVPESFPSEDDRLSVYSMTADGKVESDYASVAILDNVRYIKLSLSDFTKTYAIAVQKSKNYNEKDGVPYYTGADGKDVYVGFAAYGRYLAPDGVKVSVKKNSKSFSDITGHWAEDSINFVTERGIMVGTDDSRFSPDSGVTRAMFATVVGRLYERSFGLGKAYGSTAYTDCDYTSWYGTYVNWASDNGIVQGYGNGEFGPDDFITREQMAVLLYRYAKLLNILPEKIDTELKCTDSSSIESWAKDAVLFCQTEDIIALRDDGSFKPNDTATRAEVAAAVEALVELALY